MHRTLMPIGLLCTINNLGNLSNVPNEAANEQNEADDNWQPTDKQDDEFSAKKWITTSWNVFMIEWSACCSLRNTYKAVFTQQCASI